MYSVWSVSPLLVFLKDAPGSHLIQTVFKFSPKALLRNVYKNHLKEQLMSLALHPIANYTVQTLIWSSSGLGLVCVVVSPQFTSV